jgi:hypothetical protein
MGYRNFIARDRLAPQGEPHRHDRHDYRRPRLIHSRNSHLQVHSARDEGQVQRVKEKEKEKEKVQALERKPHHPDWLYRPSPPGNALSKEGLRAPVGTPAPVQVQVQVQAQAPAQVSDSPPGCLPHGHPRTSTLRPSEQLNSELLKLTGIIHLANQARANM